MTKRQRRANRNAVVIGCAATVFVLAADRLGWLERVEWMALDLRFRYANSMPERADIVCVDIDDSSLDEVGRWPWTRELQAALVELLADAGARGTLVDLTWSEAQPIRSVTDDDLDMTDDPLAVAHAALETSLPDHELAAAIAEAGNVYVNYHYPARDLESCPEFQAAVDALLAGDNAGARAAIERIDAARPAHLRFAALSELDQAREDHPLERARIVAALERSPLLTAEQVAAALAQPIDFVTRAHPRARLAAVTRRVRSWLHEDPSRWSLPPHEIYATLHRALIGRTIENRTPLRPVLAMALRTVLGIEATARNPVTSLEAVEAAAVRIEGMTPSYYLHARAARRAGFAVFDEPDDDGVVRRTPLLARFDRHVLAQLALSFFADDRAIAADGWRSRPGRLLLQTGGDAPQTLTIQLDERGRTLIPWLAKADWIAQFDHISAKGIVSIHQRQGLIEHNQRVVVQTLRRMAEDARVGPREAIVRAVDDFERLRDQVREARYRGEHEEAEALREILAAAETAVDEIERTVVARARAAPAADPAADDSLADGVALLEQCRAGTASLRESIASDRQALRRRVEGKVCLIGYTGTSLADMKPIPTSKSAAGVMAHANLLNGLLSGRMVRWASYFQNGLFAALFGAMATACATYSRPRMAAALAVAGCVVVVGVAAGLFYVRMYWLAVTPALAAITLSFVAISVYRFVFIDSERRQLATALGQYTSKEIARQVAENPELCQRAETREVTAMFTDLRGFTTISERIGAERTQRVLNLCLGQFVDVMLRHEAMVNKFIGDGIFAFWNPVIRPQSDHALRACETAVDLLVALDELKREQAAAGGDPAFGELLLRVGVATGNAVVGPCGSEQKFDYTCIGDSVNLAARLESANKFFGTRVLIAGGAYAYVRDRFAVRSLGGVQVKGKTSAVPVYELLGRSGDVEAERIAYAERFAAAVASFQRRAWDEAIRAFEACRAVRADDLAAENYLEAAIAWRDDPPPREWNGAIELTEK